MGKIFLLSKLVYARHKRKRITKSRLKKGGFYCSGSKFSEEKISSFKNSVRGISKPLAIMMTVLKVTVLLRPFIMHCILPCCMPEDCSKRY